MARRRSSDEIFIEGTVKTVAEIGIENMRTKHVANYAGFTEATMYRRFPTKEILLRNAFLSVDKKISDIWTQSAFIREPEKVPVEMGFYAVWSKVYRYLVEHKDETLFLIRYRYSSLYTSEIRDKRQIYNGAFEPVYAVLEKYCGENDHSNLAVVMASVYEITLGLAEKVIAGSFENTEKTEESIWLAVSSAVQSLIMQNGGSQAYDRERASKAQ